MTERSRLIARCSISGITVIAIVLFAANASAGSFTVVSCEQTASSAGWAAFSENAPGSIIQNATCSAAWPQIPGNELGVFPPAMEAGLPTGSPPAARTGLQFAAPGDTIEGGEIWVNGETTEGTPNQHSGDREIQVASGTPEGVFWKKLRGAQRVPIPAGGTRLYADAACRAKPCEAENIYVMGAHVELSPSVTPTVPTISGSLSTGGSVHGTQTASFTASDVGGPGVYQVTVAIDEKVVYQGTPAPDGGTCAPIGIYGGSLEFLTAQPCPASVPIALPVTTGALPDGIHALTVTATDPAGLTSKASEIIFKSENLITAAGAGRVTRPLGPATTPNYLLNIEHGETLLKGFYREYNDSAIAIAGALTTPLGVPAPGVAVHLLASSSTGSQRVLAATTTNALGHWVLAAPNGPSRTLRVTYGQATAAAAGVLGVKVGTETVSPSVTMHIRDRRGGHLLITGRVAITPLGQPRPLVLVQASVDAHDWQIFGHEVRVMNSHGSYRLDWSTPGSVGGRFAFRAVAPATSEWQRGLSASQWLKVR
jgi:hypothetical protein